MRLDIPQKEHRKTLRKRYSCNHFRLECKHTYWPCVLFIYLNTLIKGEPNT